MLISYYNCHQNYWIFIWLKSVWFCNLLLFLFITNSFVLILHIFFLHPVCIWTSAEQLCKPVVFCKVTVPMLTVMLYKLQRTKHNLIYRTAMLCNSDITFWTYSFPCTLAKCDSSITLLSVYQWGPIKMLAHKKQKKVFFITTELTFPPTHSFNIHLSIFSYLRVSAPSLLGGIRGQVSDREGMVSNAACLETDADRPVFRVEKEESSWRLLGF